jgi:hypothetical protein
MDGYKKYNETLDYIEKLEKQGKVIVIRPSKPVNVGRLERNQEKLKDLLQNGYEDAKNSYEKIMEFRGDTSGLDELLESVDDRYYNTLSQIGRDATRNAKINKTYENRTGNLNNANGGCVVRNGKIVDMWVESDGSHSEAVRNTENLLIYSEKSKDGLYLANGQPYASYVESKGFEVIMTNGILYAGRQIEKKL